MRKEHLIISRAHGGPRWNLGESHEQTRFFALSLDLMAVGNLGSRWWNQVNSTCCRLLGWTEEELLARPIFGFAHPDDLANGEAALSALVAGKALREFEHRSRCKDGSYRLISWNATPYPTEKLVYCVGRDITGQRQAQDALRNSEQRLSLAKTAGHIGIYDHNPITGELLLDERVRELWGLGPTDPVSMEGFISRLAPEDRAATKAAVLRALDPAGNGSYKVECRLRRGNRTLWITTMGLATFAEGRAVRLVGTVLDSSEQKHFQAELERLVSQRTAELYGMVSELEHISHAITHDMRAPLRAMRGFGEISLELLDDSASPEAKTLLHKIITSAKRLDLFITEALRYTRTVRQEFRLRPVDPGKLLEGMLHSYPNFLANRSHIRIDGSLPCLLANAAGLTQCFSNLIDNALKFVAPGHDPEVRIWGEHLVKPEGDSGEPIAWVRIWVEDKGIGIPPMMLPHVFDMFSRGANEVGSTGIGLAIVRKTVERMEGKVGVLSERGKGSRFWMEFRSGDVRSAAK